jgi:hypothetical protein
MRKTALCLIFILMLAGAVRAQNIFTALHLNDDIEYRGRNPKKIVETNIFFTSKGKKVNKSWKFLTLPECCFQRNVLMMMEMLKQD